MISREISPPPLSDDSAVGSMASCNGFSHQNAGGLYQVSPSQSNPSTRLYLGSSSSKSGPTHPQPPSFTYSQQPHQNQQASQQKDQTVNRVAVREIVHKNELVNVASRMRYNNTTLTSRSIRAQLACFDELDLRKFTNHNDYMINFISIGSNKCPSSIQRPVSILWPSSYDHMVEELAELDAYLINTEFLERPIDWMLQRKLTTIPLCNQCKCDMILKYEKDTAKWVCNRTQPCLNSYTSLHRPGFFKDYESIGLTKILFAIYYWSASTQLDFIGSRLRLDRLVLYGVWKRIQNVCRAALENLPYQLTSNIDKTRTADAPINCAPVDLISIKFNRNYIVCAKHPMFNQIKLGLYIPNHSMYSFADLTMSWFETGTKIRICEPKFLELSKKRSDLIIDMTTKVQMINKPDGTFNRTSAFGYLICQLTNTFKDFDSSSVSNETLKLILAEMQWRELYGTTPYYAFTNIIEHIAKYERFAESYTELTQKNAKQEVVISDDIIDDGFVYAEKYFYAEFFPIDKYGKIIRTWGQSTEGLPQPVAQFHCHICNNSYESFYFSMHIIAHIENVRKENDTRLYKGKRLMECKHCFKPFNREELLDHSALLRLHHHMMKFGCRICYIKFNDRNSYLKHMRRIHFQHETPYRCPSCKYATSFQRELFIHFQEAHRNSFILMCPFCLRSFTIKDPQKLTPEVMKLVSLTIYNHFVDHYVKANCYTCSNCCLTFLSKNSLRRHKARHHNPLEIRMGGDSLLQEFIILSEEEQFCVKAMPMELFIANKRPNIKIGEALQVFSESHLFTDETDEEAEVTSDESDCESVQKATIHVRDPEKASEFLVGGKATIHISKKTKMTPDDELSSERIVELLGKKAKVDQMIPNQSILIAPNGEPTRCLECNEYLTVDHYVAEIGCKKCGFKTHCPRAAQRHRESASLHDRLDGTQFRLKTLKTKYSNSDLS